jgi:hypothetical protein
MHPDAAMFRNKARPDDLGETKMASDKPPDEVFPLLLPATIFGFNMKTKTWGEYLDKSNRTTANQRYQ